MGLNPNLVFYYGKLTEFNEEMWITLTKLINLYKKVLKSFNISESIWKDRTPF